MEVCIVGGGFSGISSAKTCKDYNLVPTIFEKTSKKGGVWNGLSTNISAWDSMHTNTHKIFMSFSDFAWPEEHDDYPHRDQVYEYMSQYCAKNDLEQYFHYNSEVTRVEESGGNFIVKWVENGENKEKVFNYVIVASGKYSKETNPFPHSEDFKGTIIQGGLYRSPQVFENKRVVTIGKSSTASDVALDALRTAQSVSQIYRETSLCMKKFFNGVPYEFFYYRLHNMKNPYSLIPSLDSHSASSKILINLTGNPGEVLPEWELTEEFSQSKWVNTYVLGEDYLNAVSQGRIKCIQGDVSHFYENGLVLTDGRQVEADVVIVSTGYSSSYPFLSQSILDIVQFDPSNRRLACVLFRSVFHPALKKLCFVGNYVFGVLSRYEVESELGVRYMLGLLDLTEDEIMQGIKDEEYIRTLNGLKQPYDHFNYVKDLARLMKLNVDYEFIDNELLFSKGLMIPQFLFLDKPGVKEEARKVVQWVKEKYPNFLVN